LRGMNTTGGVRRNIGDKNELISKELATLQKNFRELMELLISSPSVADRIENTGASLMR